MGENVLRGKEGYDQRYNDTYIESIAAEGKKVVWT